VVASLCKRVGNALPMTQKQFMGKYGEDLSAKYLQDRGYQIIERNWRCNLGEIDLIAKEGNRIIFVEVKTRNGSGYGHPFEAITALKVSRMRKLAAQWCAENKSAGSKVRLDAIAVLIQNGKVAIEHLKQVF
jgi:putative endonuclease